MHRVGGPSDEHLSLASLCSAGTLWSNEKCSAAGKYICFLMIVKHRPPSIKYFHSDLSHVALLSTLPTNRQTQVVESMSQLAEILPHLPRSSPIETERRLTGMPPASPR
jgi:hypothetical protein